MASGVIFTSMYLNMEAAEDVQLIVVVNIEDAVVGVYDDAPDCAHDAFLQVAEFLLAGLKSAVCSGVRIGEHPCVPNKHFLLAIWLSLLRKLRLFPREQL